MTPTAKGPMIVQSKIAHVTMRKRSEVPVDCVGDEKKPVLSAKEEMRKPISPRAVMAEPSIRGG